MISGTMTCIEINRSDLKTTIQMAHALGSIVIVTVDDEEKCGPMTYRAQIC